MRQWKTALCKMTLCPGFLWILFFFCIPAKLSFYSICTQTLQRNLEPDPIPALCVVRDSDRIIIITAKHHKKRFPYFFRIWFSLIYGTIKNVSMRPLCRGETTTHSVFSLRCLWIWLKLWFRCCDVMKPIRPRVKLLQGQRSGQIRGDIVWYYAHFSTLLQVYCLFQYCLRTHWIF